MQKAKEKVLGIIVKSANHSLKRDANSTTCCMIYQPKAPAALKEFKSEKNAK